MKRDKGNTPGPLAGKEETARWRRKRDLGFTLVELTVALGVIAVALFAAMTLIVHTAATSEAQRELGVAKEASTRVLEALKSQNPSGSQTYLQALQAHLESAYGPSVPQTIRGMTFHVTTFPVPGLSWPSWTPSSGVASPQGMGTITMDPSNEQLIGVTVQIDWKSIGRNSTYAVTGMFAQGMFR